MQSIRTMASWENFTMSRHYEYHTHALLQNLNVYILLLLLGPLLIRYFPKSIDGNRLVKVPIVGPKISCIARWRFLSNAGEVVNEGYSKVVLHSKDHIATIDILPVQEQHVQT